MRNCPNNQYQSPPNHQPPSIARIVPWSHQLVTEVLEPGDLAVDLTAGKGRDTLALAQAVGESGQVVAFDLQKAALEQTAQTLRREGFTPRYASADEVLPEPPGVYLVHSCHTRLGSILDGRAKAIIANLGYLPGGDPELTTHVESTLTVLQQALDLLTPGGRLAVVVYPAHPGGDEEGEAVKLLLTRLPRDNWMVLALEVANRPEAPYLLVAEYRK